VVVQPYAVSIVRQIDHVVALAAAWAKGAQRWPAAKRVGFANDSVKLLAVDGPSNARKGAGDAATWLPPAKGYRCRYVARQATVKRAYGLTVTAAERAAMLRMLAGCPTQRGITTTRFRLGCGTTTPHQGRHRSPRRRLHRRGRCTTPTATPSGPPAARRSTAATQWPKFDRDGIGCE